MTTITDPHGPASEQAPGARTSPVGVLAAIASAGAGALHLGHAPQHAAEWRSLALAFALVGWLQLLGATALLVRPSRRVLATVAGLNGMAIAAFAVVHARGWPAGPLRGTAEPISGDDLAIVALELAAVAGALLARRAVVAGPGRARPQRSRWSFAVTVVPALAVVGLTSLALAGPGVDHGHGHVEGASSAAGDGVAHDGVAPVGVAPGEVAHDHPPCADDVTEGQRAAADELLAATEATLTGFDDVDRALERGYELWTPPGGGPGSHYVNPDYVLDGALLDPARPEALVYAPVGTERVLLGAMYLAPDGSPAPAPGGCLTRWHTHTDACIAAGQGIVARPGADGTCPGGSEQRSTMQMLHAWIIDVPDPFGDALGRDVLVPAVRAELAED